MPLLAHESFGFRIQTVECSHCGLVYSNPRPSSSYLKDFYDRRYRFFYEGMRRIDAAYIRKRRLRELAISRFNRYAKYLPAGVKLLDVGCGAGLFLDEARAKVPDARLFGIEPDSIAVQYCRRELGLEVHQGFLEDCEGWEPVDAIGAFHLIEHIDGLNQFVQALRAKLEPGGLVFLETPNCYGSWNGIGMFHLAHLQTFSPETLGNLFRRNGFEVLASGEIEDNLEFSNLFLVARENPMQRSELRTRDEAASQKLRDKCRQIKSRRALRVLRTWAKLAYYSAGGQQP